MRNVRYDGGIIPPVHSEPQKFVAMNSERLTQDISHFNQLEYMKLSVGIAEWMSELLEETIDSDLCVSLASGYQICRLINEYIPGGTLNTRIHKNATPGSAFAADNIHTFSQKCIQLGIRKTFVLNQSHFEKKQIKEILCCLLLLCYYGKVKNMRNSLPALEDESIMSLMPSTSGGFSVDIQESVHSDVENEPVPLTAVPNYPRSEPRLVSSSTPVSDIRSMDIDAEAHVPIAQPQQLFRSIDVKSQLRQLGSSMDCDRTILIFSLLFSALLGMIVKLSKLY